MAPTPPPPPPLPFGRPPPPPTNTNPRGSGSGNRTRGHGGMAASQHHPPRCHLSSVAHRPPTPTPMVAAVAVAAVETAPASQQRGGVTTPPSAVPRTTDHC